MQKEVKRAVKSEPEAFVREKFLFKKEDNGGVDDMKDDIREEDVEESLHGVDMLGMSNRAGGVRNLFANAFLAGLVGPLLKALDKSAPEFGTGSN